MGERRKTLPFLSVLYPRYLPWREGKVLSAACGSIIFFYMVRKGVDPRPGNSIAQDFTGSCAVKNGTVLPVVREGVYC